MKAYNVYPINPWENGCLLVFAHNVNQAKVMGYKSYWDCDCDYTDMRARRAKAFDQYAEGDKPYGIETNDDLPEGAEPFYFDEEDIDGMA